MLKNLKLPVYVFIMTTLLSIALNTKVEATSWVELEPEEVNEKAEVIVVGTYDFSNEEIPSDFIFSGFTFNVKSVYRGEVNEKIIAGIDQNGIGSVEEFQNEDGQFLLFLEEGKDGNSLIPVGGPNGMIRIKNGEVFDQTGIKKVFYEEILRGESKEPHMENSKPIEKNVDSSIPLVIGAVVLISGGAGFLIYRRLRKV